jgi:hypothetical protein
MGSEAIVLAAEQTFQVLVAMDPAPADSARIRKLQDDPSNRRWLAFYAQEIAKGRANRERLAALQGALQEP